MSLSPITVNLARKREKTMLVLRFLRTTLYSTAEILGSVMGIQTRSPIHRTLKAIERSRLIQCIHGENFGGITLWGITAAGQRFCLHPRASANARKRDQESDSKAAGKPHLLSRTTDDQLQDFSVFQLGKLPNLEAHADAKAKPNAHAARHAPS